MYIATDIAQLPGVAPSKRIEGGIAAGQWSVAGTDSCLLYRYTSHVLEVRNLAILSLSAPESLATLSTTQLQINTVEDLEIAHVEPVTLNDTQYMLVFARETLSKTGRLYTFNAYTLSVHRVTATVPYRPTAIGVSPPVRAGQGSSTEWEFAVVCFGMDKGRVVVGNLTIGGDGSQITGLSKHSMDAHRCATTRVCVRERVDAPGRVLAWLGMESGSVVALEYRPFEGGQIAHVCSITESARLGPVAQIAASALDGSRVLVCAGHGSTVAVYVAQLDQEPVVSHVATHQVQTVLEETQELKMCELVDLQVLDPQNDTLIIAALAATPAAERRDRVRAAGRRAPNADTVYGFFTAWTYDEQEGKLAEISRQTMSGPDTGLGMHVPGPDAVLGMHISGSALQLEVATTGQLLIGDALTDGVVYDTTDAHNVGEYLDIDGAFAYPPRQRHALAEQRRQLDGELFIDLLLRMTGAKRTAYPPRTPADQHALLARIGASDLDDVKQQCIAYYMVLDSSSSDLVSANGAYAEKDSDPTAANEMAGKYTSAVQLPRHFVYLMRGYWLLDHGQIAAGIPYLSDPSVVADWAPKILAAAVSGGHYSGAMQFLDSATALLQPPRLDEQPVSAPTVMDVLLHCDFGRAFEFQRTHAPALRRILLTQLFSFALSPQTRRSTIDQLSTLPFDGVEETSLAAYCLGPDVRVAHARDFLALHYVNCGRYAEAIRLFKAISKREEGEALSGVQRMKRDERLAMVKNLNMLLPEAQRGVADELESMDEGMHGVHEANHAESTVKARDEIMHDRPVPSRVEPTVRAMDVDAAVPRVSERPVAANVPLSASKAARQQKSVVGVHGVPQSPLLRVLMRQVTAEKPALRTTNLVATKIESLPETDEPETVDPDVPATPRAANGTNRAPATPWKTPMSELPTDTQSPHSEARRVLFSGPPSTPRPSTTLDADAVTPDRQGNLADAGQTPGRGILAQAKADTPVKRVPGGFPELSPLSRSPFERAKQSAKQRAPVETSTQRYNLRTRTGATPSKPPARASRQVSKLSDSDESSGKQSAREFERSLRKSTVDAKPISRTRKRE
ncbi:hypothetical protein EV180_002383 [Coemansia sp. RSA 518]|nr:hypothetical protein EV180_002383 [Coemansia sp. RSA 518]